VIVRMLYDPAFVQRVYGDPWAATADCDVTDDAAMDAAFAALAVAIIDLRELFVAHSSPIVRARYPLLTFMGAALIIGMVQDYSHEVVLSLLLPATYFGHFYVLRSYQLQREADLGRQIRLRERYLEALFDFMTHTRSAVEKSAPTESVLDYVLATVAESVQGESAAALLVGNDGLLHVKATYGFFPPPYEIPASTKKKIGAVEKYFRSRAIQIGETVFGEAVQRTKPIFIQRCEADPRMAHLVGDKVGYMSSLIVVPLIIDGRSIGAVAVAHREEGRFFSQEDYSHATVLAEYASLTLDNLFNYMEILEKKQIEKEISMAADIQRGMLPMGLPALSRAEVGSFTRAARGVSGDYYDYFAMHNSGRIVLTICDVAGKGVPASLVMVMIRTIMHLLSSTSMDAATMTRWINEGVTGSVDLGRFATFSILVYDPHTRSLEYSNAGHLPIILYRSATESVEILHCDGLPIGIERDAHYETRRYTLEPNDVLLMYTDGIVEAKNHERLEYGRPQLEAVLTRHRREEAQQIVNAIADSVDRFTENETQFDDQTLLAMKVG
jgi:sigma-B regulation protein RsbU (phosphoserine phosphatase)